MLHAPLRIVIVGGGSAGWMCAAAAAQVLHPERYRLTLIESDDIGTVGVGEATLPALRDFNELLGLDEAQFMRETQGTFKLGIEFRDWDVPAKLHPSLRRVRRALGRRGVPAFLDARASPGTQSPAARGILGRGARLPPQRLRFPESEVTRSTFYGYAYHFDASLYAEFLRRWSIARGVTRIEGQVVDVALDGQPATSNLSR